MDKPEYDYQEEVSEADFDLFYGLVDSIFDEARQNATQAGTHIKKPAPDSRSSEPFEEFLVGIPSPDVAELYSLHTVEYQPPIAALPAAPQKSNDSLIGGILGLMLGIVIMLMTSYIISKPEPGEATTNMHAEWVKLEDGLNAVHTNVKAVHSLEQHVTSMEAKLGELTAMLAAQASTQSVQVKDKATQQPIGIRSNAAWVVNLVSVRSGAKAAQLLSYLQSRGIMAESMAVNVKGKQWIRIRVAGGFASRSQAEQSLPRFAKQTGFKSIWVGRKQPDQ